MKGEDIFGGEWAVGTEKEDGKEKQTPEEVEKNIETGSREGKWENGQGRCPVTGRRVLGGTGGIRRVMI